MWNGAFEMEGIDRTENCSCNPYWLMFLEDNFPVDDGTGIACDVFCESSAMMAIATRVQAVYEIDDKNVGGITKFWGIANRDAFRCAFFLLRRLCLKKSQYVCHAMGRVALDEYHCCHVLRIAR